MPQVIEIVDNLVIGIHQCKTNGQAIDLFRTIIKETINGADRWPDEDFNEVTDEGYIMLDGGNGSICLNLDTDCLRLSEKEALQIALQVENLVCEQLKLKAKQQGADFCGMTDANPGVQAVINALVKNYS